MQTSWHLIKYALQQTLNWAEFNTDVANQLV